MSVLTRRFEDFFDFAGIFPLFFRRGPQNFSRIFLICPFPPKKGPTRTFPNGYKTQWGPFPKNGKPPGLGNPLPSPKSLPSQGGTQVTIGGFAPAGLRTLQMRFHLCSSAQHQTILSKVLMLSGHSMKPESPSKKGVWTESGKPWEQKICPVLRPAPGHSWES